METKTIKDYKDKTASYIVYTIGAVIILLYFNLGRAYKGENQAIYISFAALCLFDLIWYIVYFSSEIRFFYSLFAKIRLGLKGSVIANTMIMAIYGPNESWFVAIIILVAFFIVEKGAYTFKLATIMEKAKTENEQNQLS